MCQTQNAADIAVIKLENLGQFSDVPDLPLVDVTLPFAAAGNRHQECCPALISDRTIRQDEALAVATHLQVEGNAHEYIPVGEHPW